MMNDLHSSTPYSLQSQYSGSIYQDTGWMLEAPGEDKPSLLRAIYNARQLTLRGDEYGIYTFADWLPVHRMLQGSGAPITYRSEALAGELGLSNLWITFSGWWPERGAFMKSASFKETEAYCVGGRLPEDESRRLVVASAGNTARSFARVCSENEIPLLLCVPEDNLDALWFDAPLNDCVQLISSR
ncbi:MAG: cysteate synthase, partial [Bacteroidales bacterium]|nr:cysteate synthase [Bacteroidales bacterium]